MKYFSLAVAANTKTDNKHRELDGATDAGWLTFKELVNKVTQ